ncbi:hypothetical protein L7F22_055196 [Adiantum nelumboides]|nr:hypothetical protein [Adiantum nelumboides]
MHRESFHGQQQDRHGATLPFDNYSDEPPRPSPSPDQLLQLLCKSGLLDRAVDALSHLHTLLVDSTYLCLLKACIKHRCPAHAKQVQAHIAHHQAPAQFRGFLAGYLVIALARCGAVEDALQVALTLPRLNVFSWTAIISAYIDRRSWHQALHMYSQMDADGIQPDSHTFVSLFKACGELSDLAAGKNFHADAQKKGIATVTCVGNSLVSMYGKCRAVLEAEHMLTMLPEPDVVSWNAMLSVLVEQGRGERALLLYRQMQKEGASPNLLTYVFVFQACGVLAEDNTFLAQSRSVKLVALDIGQAVHADANRSGFTADVLVGTTLVSMYKKCGSLTRAENVFSAMRQHNAVSWTAMLSACVEHGHGERALCLYKEVRGEGFTPNQLTYLFALQACVILADKGIGTNGLSTKVVALEVGQGLCMDARRDNFIEEPSISSTLLSLYGKCGALEEAEGLFNILSVRNVVSWTAMLSAYVEQRQSIKALQLFKDLKEESVLVDVVVLLYVLQACSETGSLSTCKQLHFEIVSSGHDSLPLVAATLIHVYGGCASIPDQHAVFDRASNPNLIIWNACCAGDAGDERFSTSLQMFEKLELAGLLPDEVTYSAALSSCSYVGNISLGVEIFVSMIRDGGIHPDLRHYGSMVDMLVRAGKFHGVENMLERMSTEADYALWFCLLNACRIHGNIELAKRAFDRAVKLMPNSASPYIMLSNIYAEAGLHELANEVENSGQTEGGWDVGSEWIEPDYCSNKVKLQ